MNQYPPGPQVFRWGCFEFFRKFAEIFANEYLSPVSTTPAINCSAVSMTPAKNLSPVSLIHPCHREITKNFSPSQWHLWLKSPAYISLPTTKNLKKAKIQSFCLKSTKLSSQQNMKKKFFSTFFSFFAGVVDTADKHSFVIISEIFKKIWNGPNGILRGPGDTDLWKKTDVENLMSDSL